MYSVKLSSQNYSLEVLDQSCALYVQVYPDSKTSIQKQIILLKLAYFYVWE